ncbi:lectin-like [Arachis ipaensis]|uniref:lectin-like n=1 Tax=Arachis ipaensis TaxID=130454 RepID=UPI0007AF9480|nr:lectin-like [Arachis ipaensis]
MEYHAFESSNVFCTGLAFVPKEEGGIEMEEEKDDGWIIAFVHNDDINLSQDTLREYRKEIMLEIIVDPNNFALAQALKFLDKSPQPTVHHNHPRNKLSAKIVNFSLWSFEYIYSYFRISKPYNTEYTPGPGDGLAFFLASADTEIPPESSGKFLGLFNDASDRIVAVEFDTFSNSDIGDPNYPHIGIDVNSIRSSKVCYWNFHDAAITTAKITYNSAHKKLIVHVSTYLHSQPDTLTYDVDLSTKLPEKVKIGISASTGQFSQTTEILSWIFKSN